MSPDVLIHARGLAKRYKDVVAVDGVDLDLRRGECLALLGVNGAGKTTLCEILEGLILPDAGSLSILGKNYSTDRQAILSEIGVQLQETHLYKKFTVKETLDLFASFYPTTTDRASLLKRLHLKDLENKRLEHLSGGQKQAVYLACTLINQPTLIFLDEPTSGLDPHARARTWRLIEDMKDHRRGILLTTHYLEEAEMLADRLAFIDKGKIVALGTADELIRQYCPGEIFEMRMDEAHWKASSPKALERFDWLHEAKVTDEGFQFSTSENSQDKLSTFVRWATDEGLRFTSLSMRRSTLEDVYFTITGKVLPS